MKQTFKVYNKINLKLFHQPQYIIYINSVSEELHKRFEVNKYKFIIIFLMYKIVLNIILNVNIV